MLQENVFQIYKDFFDEIELIFQQAINVTKDLDELHHMAKDMRLKAKELIATQKEYLRRDAEFADMIPYHKKMEFQRQFASLCKLGPKTSTAIMMRVRELPDSDKFLDFTPNGKCRLIIDKITVEQFPAVNKIMIEEAKKANFKLQPEKQEEAGHSEEKGIVTDEIDEPSAPEEEMIKPAAKKQEQNLQKRQKRS